MVMRVVQLHESYIYMLLVGGWILHRNGNIDGKCEDGYELEINWFIYKDSVKPQLRPDDEHKNDLFLQ